MKSLGGVILPDQLVWEGQYDWAPVSQEVVRTLSGTHVIFTSPLLGGRPITLVATESIAWFSQSQVDDLQRLAGQPGAIHTLVWEDTSLSVVFRHHEPPALVAVPIYPAATLYTGTVKLFEV